MGSYFSLFLKQNELAGLGTKSSDGTLKIKFESFKKLFITGCTGGYSFSLFFSGYQKTIGQN